MWALAVQAYSCTSKDDGMPRWRRCSRLNAHSNVTAGGTGRPRSTRKPRPNSRSLCSSCGGRGCGCEMRCHEGTSDAFADAGQSHTQHDQGGHEPRCQAVSEHTAGMKAVACNLLIAACEVALRGLPVAQVPDAAMESPPLLHLPACSRAPALLAPLHRSPRGQRRSACRKEVERRSTCGICWQHHGRGCGDKVPQDAYSTRRACSIGRDYAIPELDVPRREVRAVPDGGPLHRLPLLCKGWLVLHTGSPHAWSDLRLLQRQPSLVRDLLRPGQRVQDR